MNKHYEFEAPKPSGKEQKAAQLRAEFPECAAMADEMRVLFGSAEVLSMTENGKTLNRVSYKPDSEFSTVIDGEQFLRLGVLIKQEKERAEERAKNARRK
jgi:hypothetical protein